MPMKWWAQMILFCGMIMCLLFIAVWLIANSDVDERDLEFEGDIDKIQIRV